VETSQTSTRRDERQESACRLYLYGVPGVGKTHLARRLSAQTDAGLFEADALRDLALSQAAGPHDPALDRGTTEAYRLYGAPNPENILRGLTDVRAALSPWLVARLRDHPDAAITEAAFLEPASLLAWGQPCLLCCPRLRQHARRFFRHRPWRFSSLRSFWVARRLQLLLLTEAHRLGIPVVCTADERSALARLKSLLRTDLGR